ncbi:MAG: FAD-dependent oxidoreductase [Verrucomicrobiota bacterium]
MNNKYDVVVIGGGTAGTIAAIQAGREGAETLLVEKNAMLGGTMTIGGVNYPARFFAWGQQVIAGIGWELVCKTLVETGRQIPKPEETRPREINVPVYAALADETVLNAGVDVLFHTMPASITFTNQGWTLQICTKTGLQNINAETLIDATGDANAVALAGFEVVRPDIFQPATLTFGCSGYDAEKLDYEALRSASETAIKSGELATTDISWRNNGPEALLRKYGNNSNHVRAPHAETSEGKSLVEIEGRKAILRMYRFFRKQPGLENFRIDWVCSETGIRETGSIRGKKTVSVSDYEAGRMYDDALCYAFYSIDEHLNDGKGFNARRLKQGILPTIPRAAMLPQGSKFLIAAGRCVASDREANSALRVECPCMAMGQAAGAMAALSARTGIDPEEIPLDDIRSLLRKHKAVIPGDIKPHRG